MVSLLSLPLNFETVVLIDASKKCCSEYSIRFLSTPRAASLSSRIRAYTAGMNSMNSMDVMDVNTVVGVVVSTGSMLGVVRVEYAGSSHCAS